MHSSISIGCKWMNNNCKIKLIEFQIYFSIFFALRMQKIKGTRKKSSSLQIMGHSSAFDQMNYGIFSLMNHGNIIENGEKNLSQTVNLRDDSDGLVAPYILGRSRLSIKSFKLLYKSYDILKRIIARCCLVLSSEFCVKITDPIYNLMSIAAKNGFLMLLGTDNKAGLFMSGIHVGKKVKTGPPTSEIL